MPELGQRHFLAFAIFIGVIATFHFGPDILSFDSDIRTLWMATAQIGGTLLACIVCLIAARHGEPGADEPLRLVPGAQLVPAVPRRGPDLRPAGRSRCGDPRQRERRLTSSGQPELIR